MDREWGQGCCSWSGGGLAASDFSDSLVQMGTDGQPSRPACLTHSGLSLGPGVGASAPSPPRAGPVKPHRCSLRAELKSCGDECTAPQACPLLSLFFHVHTKCGRCWGSGVTSCWAQLGRKGPHWAPRRMDSRKLQGNHPGSRIRRGWLHRYHYTPASSPQEALFRERAWGEPPPQSHFLCILFLLLKRKHRGRRRGGTFQLRLGHILVAWLGRKGHLPVPASKVGKVRLLAAALSPRQGSWGFRGWAHTLPGKQTPGASIWMHCSFYMAFGSLSCSRMWVCPYKFLHTSRLPSQPKACPLSISWVIREQRLEAGTVQAPGSSEAHRTAGLQDCRNNSLLQSAKSCPHVITGMIKCHP